MKPLIALITLSISQFVLADEINHFVTVPINMINRLPLIEVKLNGKPHQLLLDLGSTYTNVSLNQQITTHIPVNYTGKTFLMSNECSDQINSYRLLTLPRVDIGTFTYMNVKGYEYTNPPGCSDSPVVNEIFKHGIIGISMINQHNFIIDYRNNQFVIFDGKLPPQYQSKKWWTVKLLGDTNHGILTKGRVGNKDVKMLWDTGSNESILSEEFAHNQSVKCVTGNSDCKIVTVDSFSIDGHRYPQLQFYKKKMHQKSFAISIGANFYEQHVVLIDFKNKTLSVEME